MKRFMLITGFLVAMVAGIAEAQQTPRVDQRQHVQRARIRQGVDSGEVTRPEAARLRAEQRHIRRSKHRAKADGEVTARERARLHRKQNKLGRDIRRQKHDDQRRD